MIPLEFNLELNVIPVTFSVEAGKKEECELVELTGAERDLYLNKLKAKLKNKSGKVSADGVPENFEGMHSLLVSKSLRRCVDKSYFTETEIQKFPAKVLSELYKAATELSGLNVEEDDDKPGN